MDCIIDATTEENVGKLIRGDYLCHLICLNYLFQNTSIITKRKNIQPGDAVEDLAF
jgi:hypothetical protein